MKVKDGEAVTVGHLVVTARRASPAKIMLTILHPDGSSQQLAPPLVDTIPGVTIAARIENAQTRLLIDAPREIPITRVPKNNI